MPEGDELAEARIPVTKTTQERLAAIMSKRETYDEAVNRLIDAVEGRIGKRGGK